MAEIKLLGRKYELVYDLQAMTEIEKLCGNLSKFPEWFIREDENKGENDSLVMTSGLLARTALVIAALVNGGIFIHNYKVANGLSGGEKLQFIDGDAVTALMTVPELAEAFPLVFEAMNKGQAVTVPEGTPEPDPDLMDVASEKKDLKAVT